LSIYAALGYVVGILIFAFFFRLYRSRMTERYMDKAKVARAPLKEEN